MTTKLARNVYVVCQRIPRKHVNSRFRSSKSKEEETSLVSETTPKATQYNTGLEKSLRNGSRDIKMNVQYKNILEWPISNTKMFQV